ncbi:hypothetical protein [Lentzea sp. NBRC 102530]|uniref:hypothetical protein n=1 Tax=Lentzea sp. NBRC 102530 TaxID=3032201 RepID=UPI0024A109D8|nr:hypothetical protein [Lentzea sp. NBRC 102530]GLY53685.1 hypothetical protein Lesp01_73410 [Lentzea sp. NBRC 102530]
MSSQEIRQYGVALVAAGPGLALTAFVAGMTLPLRDFARQWLAWPGALAALGCVVAGVLVLRVPDLQRLNKLLRYCLGVPVSFGTISLLTLYTDHPGVDGLLTSLSSVVFTLAMVASAGLTLFVALRVERAAKAGNPRELGREFL